VKTRILLLSGLVLLLASGVAWAAPGGGLKGSAHDFSAAGGGVGLCTFCHTPHRALGTRLLWNHTLSAATYTWQDVTQTIGGTALPTIDQKWTGPTKYCLSCHDGSVAVGDVNWWLGGKPPAPLDNEQHAWPDTHNVGATDGILGNMSGNHPVAVPYPYGLAKNTYNGVTTGDGVILGEFVADPGVNKIRLFNNPAGSEVVAGAVAGKTGIECSSCHDPHNGSTVEDDYFLRGELKGDALPYICLKCHTK
jgi:hypothetical protein